MAAWFQRRAGEPLELLGHAGMYADPLPRIAYAEAELASGHLAEAPGLQASITDPLVEHLSLAGRFAEIDALPGAGHPFGTMVSRFWRGQRDEAERLLEEATARNLQEGNLAQLQLVRWYQGALAHYRGDQAKAEVCFRDGLELVEGTGALALELWHRPMLARALASQGRLDPARAELAKCHDLLSRCQNVRGLITLTHLATIAVGSDDEARVAFDAALEVTRRHHLPLWDADAFVELGRRSGDRASFDEARRVYERVGAERNWLDRLEASP